MHKKQYVASGSTWNASYILIFSENENILQKKTTNLLLGQSNFQK